MNYYNNSWYRDQLTEEEKVEYDKEQEKQRVEREEGMAAAKVAEKKGYEPGQIIVLETGSSSQPFEIFFIKSKMQKAKKGGKWWYKYIHVRLQGPNYQGNGEGEWHWTEEEDTWKLMDCHTSWNFDPSKEQSEASLQMIIRFKAPDSYIREILEGQIEHYQGALSILNGE